MSNEQIVRFLNWLTENGRMELGFRSRIDQPEELWLGAKQVSRSDITRIARYWPDGGGLSQESVGVLVGLALDKVSAASGRKWNNPAL